MSFASCLLPNGTAPSSIQALSCEEPFESFPCQILRPWWVVVWLVSVGPGEVEGGGLGLVEDHGAEVVACVGEEFGGGSFVVGGEVEPWLGVFGLEEVVGGGEFGGGPVGEVVGFVEVVLGEDHDAEGVRDVFVPEFGVVAPGLVVVTDPAEGAVGDEADAEVVEGEVVDGVEEGVDALLPVVVGALDAEFDGAGSGEVEVADFFAGPVVAAGEGAGFGVDLFGEDGVGGGGVDPERSLVNALEEGGIVLGEPGEAGGNELGGDGGVDGGPVTGEAAFDGGGLITKDEVGK